MENPDVYVVAHPTLKGMTACLSGAALSGTSLLWALKKAQVTPGLYYLIPGLFAALCVTFSRSSNFLLSAFANIVVDGIVTLKSNIGETSGWLALDLSVFAVVFATLDVTSPEALGVGIISFLTLTSLIYSTLFDQFKLNISDDEFKALMDKPLPEHILYREKLGKSVAVTTSDPKLEERIAKLPEYCWAEVSKHRCKTDLWIVANNLVYDITSFYEYHPGGRKVILTMGGRDCTDVLDEFHPENVFRVLPKYLVGRLKDESESEGGSSVTSESTKSVGVVEKSEAAEMPVPKLTKNQEIMKDYRKMRQILLGLGLFETDMNYYAKKFLANFTILGIAVYWVAATESVSLHLFAAVLVGVVWQQMAFVGHDTGHNAMTHERDIDYLTGSIIGCLLGGISIGWWKFSHNVHHINCNSINDDPDIQHMPVFAVAESMLSSFYSTFHSKMFVFDLASKFLLSYQHFLFYPIMAVARVNLYVQSLLFFIANPLHIQDKLNHDAEFKRVEICCMLGFFTWVGTLLYLLPTWPERVLFFLVTHAVSGVLHVQICLSHFTMKTYPGQFTDFVEEELAKCGELDDQELVDKHGENWLLLQINTTMNVDTPVLLDFFHGGLQYQIEHHLFPRLPRHNLRIAQVLVKQLCEKHGVEYRNLPFYDANVELVQRLRDTAMVARTQEVDHRDFSKSELYEGLNLIG